MCAKSLGHDGKSEEQLAAAVDVYWHVVATYLLTATLLGFCEASSAAVKTGLRLAQESNATLHLIHVDEIPVGIEDVLRLAAGNRPVPTQQPVASGTGALLL